MPDIYQIHVMRKGSQNFTTISKAPTKEVYAMLYGAIALVAQNTNQTVEATLGILADLDKFAKSTDQS